MQITAHDIADILDVVIAVLVVFAVLWGTTRQPAPPDSGFCEKDPEEDEKKT